jgi:hypothetical protein
LTNDYNKPTLKNPMDSIDKLKFAAGYLFSLYYYQYTNLPMSLR